MALASKKEIRYTKAPLAKKIKPGARTVVSSALVKKGSSNLVPKVHVKRGDMVVVISGAKDKGRGTAGKVLSVQPDEGKIVVEGVNMVTRATKPRGAMDQGGLVKKEAPIFASRVMLYCSSCKKPTRIKHKEAAGGKKVRICRHCKESFDG